MERRIVEKDIVVSPELCEDGRLYVCDGTADQNYRYEELSPGDLRHLRGLHFVNISLGTKDKDVRVVFGKRRKDWSKTEATRRDFVFLRKHSVDIGVRERALLANVDAMSFDDNAERDLYKKISGTATEEQLATLNKYSVQKHFKQELSVGDIVAVWKNKRAVLNVCSMLKLSPEERDNYFVIDTENRMEQDFLSRDHLILRNMERLLELLGYTGFGDRVTTVQLEENDSVVAALRKVTDLAVGVRGSSSNLKAVISRILKSLIGLWLELVGEATDVRCTGSPKKRLCGGLRSLRTISSGRNGRMASVKRGWCRVPMRWTLAWTSRWERGSGEHITVWF